MKNIYLFILLLSYCCVLINCTTTDPNIATGGNDAIEKYIGIGNIEQTYSDTTYISAYSEIYSQTKLSTIPLTITLSIRSGSFTDTTIINSITYYDTGGNIVNEYLKNPVYIKPMQSIDYIVAIPQKTEGKPKNRGGVGAHFIVQWGARYNTQPIMQCVMVGSHGNNSVSFMIPGKSIATRNIK